MNPLDFLLGKTKPSPRGWRTRFSASTKRLPSGESRKFLYQQYPRGGLERFYLILLLLRTQFPVIVSKKPVTPLGLLKVRVAP
jgi:hypothetical protein